MSRGRISHSPPRPDSGYRPQTVNKAPDSERKRRRDSYSSESEDEHGRGFRQGERERTNSRSTRRKFTEVSPIARGRKTESRSPYRARRPLSNDRKRMYSVEDEREPSKFYLSFVPSLSIPNFDMLEMYLVHKQYIERL